jgi:hypothetical protein
MKMNNDQIIRELEIVKDSFISESGASPVCIDEAIRVIREEVRSHGKWIVSWSCFECPYCGKRITRGNDVNYCPNCGAKMDGGEEE